MSAPFKPVVERGFGIGVCVSADIASSWDINVNAGLLYEFMGREGLSAHRLDPGLIFVSELPVRPGAPDGDERYGEFRMYSSSTKEKDVFRTSVNLALSPLVRATLLGMDLRDENFSFSEGHIDLATNMSAVLIHELEHYKMFRQRLQAPRFTRKVAFSALDKIFPALGTQRRELQQLVDNSIEEMEVRSRVAELFGEWPELSNTVILKSL